MKKIIIMGGDGPGLSVAAIVDEDENAEVLGFLNDVIPVGEYIGKYKKFPVIGKTDDVHEFLKDPDVYVFYAYFGMQHEKKVFEKLESLNIPMDRFYNAISSTAIIPKEYCKLGQGVLFNPLSQVGVDVEIGDNCIVLANAYIGHNAVLERFAHVASNAIVGGYVHIGKGCHIGTNATIKEKVKIGDFCLIGSGAVVLKDVPSNAIVVGNPARILRMKDEE